MEEISSYGVPETRRYAGFWRRVPAFIIDMVFVRIASGIVTTPVKAHMEITAYDFEALGASLDSINALFFYAGAETFIMLIIGFSYFVLFWTLGGQTVGKKIFSLKTVRTDGKELTLKDAVLRCLGYIISHIFLLGFLWAGFDGKKQGWHDKIAGTYVVKTYNSSQ